MKPLSRVSGQVEKEHVASSIKHQWPSGGGKDHNRATPPVVVSPTSARQLNRSICSNGHFVDFHSSLSTRNHQPSTMYDTYKDWAFRGGIKGAVS